MDHQRLKALRCNRPPTSEIFTLLRTEDNHLRFERGIVDSVLPLYQYQLQSDCIKVVTALHESPLPVSGNPERVQQALLNILENGHQVIRTQGRGDIIHVKTERHSSEALEKIFDPFFTTKDVGAGTGLGLALSYDIIEAHHGRIQVQNLEELEEGGGL